MTAATIDGTSVKVRNGSLSVSDVIDERTVARFTIVDPDGTLAPAKGQSVSIFDGATVLFDGYVDDPETELTEANPLKFHHLSCIDHHYLADKRLASVAYESQTVQHIVGDLHSRYLEEEGVVLGTVDDGPTVKLIVFPWIPVSEALSELAELAGYWWYIDADRTLEFRKRDAFDAPFTVGSSDVLKQSPSKLRRAAPDYRNVQYIRGVRDRTDPQTETFVGDGEARTFTVGFRIAEQPTVTVNSSAQTVGIRGVDEGRDWYWNKDARELTQDFSGTKLTGSDVLEVVYVGFFDSIIVSDNRDAITERETVEGGTGKVEHIAESRGLDSREAGFGLASAKLEKYGQIGRTFQFTTSKPGLLAGHLLPVEVPEYGLSAQMLVVRATTSVIDATHVRYTVTAVEGPHEQAWSRFFARLHEVPDVLVWRDNIAEDEIVTRLFPYSKEWQETDAQPPNFWFEIWPSDTLATSTDLYPSVDRDHWLAYVEWWDATTALGRKQVTSRSLTADEVESTFYLAPFEANAAIVDLKFYGGIGATEVLESGDLAVTVALNESKTTAEAFQIVRTDTRAATPLDWWEIGDVPA